MKRKAEDLIELDDDIIDLFRPVTLADDVKNMLKGDDSDRRSFKSALLPYKIVSEGTQDKIKNFVTKIRTSNDTLVKIIQEDKDEIARLRKVIARLRKVIESDKNEITQLRFCGFSNIKNAMVTGPSSE